MMDAVVNIPKSISMSNYPKLIINAGMQWYVAAAYQDTMAKLADLRQRETELKHSLATAIGQPGSCDDFGYAAKKRQPKKELLL